MTTKELIEILSEYPPDTAITLWHDGDRVGVDGVDDSFVESNGFVEINGA